MSAKMGQVKTQTKAILSRPNDIIMKGLFFKSRSSLSHESRHKPHESSMALFEKCIND